MWRSMLKALYSDYISTIFNTVATFTQVKVFSETWRKSINPSFQEHYHIWSLLNFFSIFQKCNRPSKFKLQISLLKAAFFWQRICLWGRWYKLLKSLACSSDLFRHYFLITANNFVLWSIIISEYSSNSYLFKTKKTIGNCEECHYIISKSLNYLYHTCSYTGLQENMKWLS